MIRTFWAEYLWAIQHNGMAQKGRDLAGNENSRFLKFGHYFCPQANLIRLHTILQIQNGSGLEKNKKQRLIKYRLKD